jgi:hypothetical protein
MLLFRQFLIIMCIGRGDNDPIAGVIHSNSSLVSRVTLITDF